jgi:hypothetical protein
MGETAIVTTTGGAETTELMALRLNLGSSDSQKAENLYDLYFRMANHPFSRDENSASNERHRRFQGQPQIVSSCTRDNAASVDRFFVTTSPARLSLSRSRSLN